ncbi:MAG: DUF3240 family protein [Gammaproteobacteria bacterium]|nr:DUF3240 family protein [Gammaproteobacteria bacterium]
MKHLTLIIHTDIQQDLTEQLRNLNQVTGFTFSPVEGHGIESENDAFLSARDKVVGCIPRVQVDILLEDDEVNLVLNSLQKTTHNIEGNGIYWITDVVQSGRL